MKHYKFSKNDFKEYKHELIMTLSYTLALLIVYCSWSYVAFDNFWISFAIAIAFIVVGCLFFYFWVNKIKERNTQKGE